MRPDIGRGISGKGFRFGEFSFCSLCRSKYSEYSSTGGVERGMDGGGLSGEEVKPIVAMSLMVGHSQTFCRL